MTVNKLKRYSQKYFLQYCYQKYIFKSCECYDIDMPSLNESLSCNISIASECGFKNFILFHENNLGSDCFKECPEECESITYDLELFHSRFPSYFYYQLMLDDHNLDKNIFSYDFVKSTSLAVNVFFREISYNVI